MLGSPFFKPGGSFSHCLRMLFICLCFLILMACFFFFSSSDRTTEMDFHLSFGSTFKVDLIGIELEPPDTSFIEIPFVKFLIVFFVVVVVEVETELMGFVEIVFRI